MNRKLLTTAALSATVLLTACASGPYANDPQARNSVVASTMAGAAIGALSRSDGDRKDIGKGTAVGAVVGAGTGYVLAK
ncbi:hypothetical protein AAX05_07065 [Moraxella bovoculi]|uniref:hypothetical protein n=1 Tax=Moraxella bovoculi TaxID=386891 RepID=UPI000624D683|nr:hypothetical protein [Moraxella bovoculi]AKG09946.1 hypothetical protein AAX05_07065 [Moraxella bovoculi]AKG13834.1 hypothetical protein AAX11_07155 [Moraxella bovoculi]